MAGEQLKSPGVNGLDTGNPLYYRGVQRTTTPPAGPRVSQKWLNVLIVLAVVYLILGIPAALLAFVLFLVL